MINREPSICYNSHSRRIEGDVLDKEATILFLLSTFWALTQESQQRLSNPPMLEGVTRVIFGSTNTHKQRGFARVMDVVRKKLRADHGFKARSDFEIETITPQGEEPADNEAILVAIDKVRRAVNALRTNRGCGKNTRTASGATREGGPALIYATDVVIGIKKNGKTEHMLNLSRMIAQAGHATTEMISAQIERLKAAYSDGPTVVEYQVAAAISRKNGGGAKEVATGVMIRLHFKEIPKEEVENAFKKFVPRVFDMNAGLPLVDGPFLKYLLRIEVAPLGQFVNTYDPQFAGKLLPGPFDQVDFIGCDVDELTDDQRQRLFANLKIWVVEAVPPTAMALFVGGTRPSVKLGTIEVV